MAASCLSGGGSPCQQDHQGLVRPVINKRQYICEECGRLFNRRSHLSSHVRTHTGERPFQCAICKKGFTQSGSLNRHMRNHDNERRLSIKDDHTNETCMECCRVFLSKKGLSAHQRAGHKKVDPPPSEVLVIPVCARIARPIPVIARKEESPERSPFESSNYEWPTCTFADNDDNIRYVDDPQWLQRPKSPKISPPASPMFNQARIQAPQPIDCMLCWQTFNHPNLLHQHLFSAHFSSPPMSPKRSFRRPMRD
uniref:C2H2-type domain-containing protein n=1 Tax=Spongospora subterranea TaxID=70186 RepID=A0A0H5R5A0_9EUKA|eukprot:CRZ09340.1 hypothetical protein [Spongospora subterranea]